MTSGTTQRSHARRRARWPLSRRGASWWWDGWDWRAWSDRRWALTLTALAWIHRCAFILSNQDRAWGFSIFYEGDAERFHLFARSILAGTPYDGGVPFHPPGFPYLLAGIHVLVGAGQPGAAVPHLGVKLILALIGSLPVGLIYLLARPYLGRTAAAATALLSLYSFGLYVISATPVSEGLYLTLLLAALLVWSRVSTHALTAPGVPSRSSTWTLGLLGLLLGALALVRAEGLLVAGLLWAVGLSGALRAPSGGLRAGAGVRWTSAGVPRAGAGERPEHSGAQPGLTRRLQPWLLVALGGVVALTPWTVRNGVRLARVNRELGPQLAEKLPTFAPITLYGPLNLALANQAGAGGGFSPIWSDPSGRRVDMGAGQLALRDPEHLHLFLHGDAVACEWIRANPGDFARLVGRKWGLLFESLKLGWTQCNFPGGLRGMRRPIDLFVPHSHLGQWLLGPLLLAGLAVLLARGGPGRRWALVVVMLTGATLLTTSLFFGYARAGVVMLPLWLSLIPGGIAALCGGSARPASPRVARAGIAAGLLLLALEAWGASASRTYTATGTMVPGQGHLTPDAVIYLEVDPATLGGWTPGR